MADFATQNPNIDRLLTEFGEGAAGAKRAMLDGDFSASDVRDVLNSLDPALGQYVGDMLGALKGVYPEIKTLLEGNPFTLMMTVVPYLATKLMVIFK